MFAFAVNARQLCEPPLHRYEQPTHSYDDTHKVREREAAHFFVLASDFYAVANADHIAAPRPEGFVQTSVLLR
jgi:hypothetical protein